MLVHFHIFKNSGTTIEHALKRQLGKRFQRFDTPGDEPAIVQSEFAQRIEENPDIRAFSSHSIRLPVPSLDGVSVAPLVFVRHPVLRLKSIYKWLRATQLKRGLRRMLGVSLGTVAHPLVQAADSASNFSDWLAIVLDSPEGVALVANAQTRILSARYGELPSRTGRDENGVPLFDLQRAKINLGSVDMLARTEHFMSDTTAFEPFLRSLGLPLDFRGVKPKNVTDPDRDLPVEWRLGELHRTIGEELFGAIHAVLQQDLALYDWVGSHLDERERSG